MEDKILKSFLNKGASFTDAKLFHEVLNKMEIDGYIFKTKRGKNASFFVKIHLIDSNKNIVSQAFSTENNTVSPPVTVKSPKAFTGRTYNNLENQHPKV